jgi:cytosine/adenosine deaminase-related metal-dependent hydrolase
MTDGTDLLVRNAFLYDREESCDIAVQNGQIQQIAPELDREAETEIDADGSLVSPGLVDCHNHLDMALSAEGERYPRYNDEGFEKQRCIGLSESHFRNSSREGIRETAVQAGRLFAANGILALRTHAYVDSEVGTKVVNAILDAREQLADLVDIQVVVFPQRGYLNASETLDHAHEALSSGADLVGGIDPASVNNDIERSIDTWFDLATAHDAAIDGHIHDGGKLGMYTLNRLAEKTIEHDYQGRVTASHAFALADTNQAGDDPRSKSTTVGGAMETFLDADLAFVACYPSMRPGHPVQRFHDAGLTMALGTDQLRDFWLAHGNADVVEGSLVSSFRLSTDYTYATNEGLDTLWRMLTSEGGDVLGDETYGIDEGTPADLVVWDQPSPQWAIIKQGTRSHVIKDGQVIATDGSLVETESGE